MLALYAPHGLHKAMREGLFIIGWMFGDTRKKIDRIVLTYLLTDKTYAAVTRRTRHSDLYCAYATLQHPPSAGSHHPLPRRHPASLRL